MPRPAIRALLIDFSGTLHIASGPTTAAAAALARVRQAGLAVRFCSNNSQEIARACCGGRPEDETAEVLGPPIRLRDEEFRSAVADAEQHHASYDCPRRVPPGAPRVDHTSSSSIPAAHPPTYANVHVETLEVAVHFTLDDWQAASEVARKLVVSLPTLPPPFPTPNTFGDHAASSTLSNT
ncbi:hypothetical protein DFH11DRAFT_1830569 [Phellopilus nigrolimitatus]|nr:hypothetical protein DFH11DRAFT_1830569 [Phellopilus nigrolimitatus]